MYKTITIEKSSVMSYNMKADKRHVAVIGGGMSAEREVSLKSAKAVMQALIDNNYRVSFIDMGIDIANVIAQIKPDIVYNSLHGTYGEDGCLPGLLNIMRIPYTHSGVLASALAFNKARSKEVFIANNIDTAKSIIVNKSDNIKDDPMPRPFVIKPVTQGSSIGIEIIFAEDEFNFSNYDFPYGNQVIIEEYISGHELQVAVLNGKAFGVLEIQLLKNRFYDYETKYSEGFANHILPASISDSIFSYLVDCSERLYNIMGCNGLVRTEFIYNEQLKKCFILELNTHPGMTELSICPEILAFHGISFTALVEELIKTASFEE